MGTRVRPAVGALIVLGLVSYQSDRGGVSFCGILKKKENDLFIEHLIHIEHLSVMRRWKRTSQPAEGDDSICKVTSVCERRAG